MSEQPNLILEYTVKNVLIRSTKLVLFYLVFCVIILPPCGVIIIIIPTKERGSFLRTEVRFLILKYMKAKQSRKNVWLLTIHVTLKYRNRNERTLDKEVWTNDLVLKYHTVIMKLIPHKVIWYYYFINLIYQYEIVCVRTIIVQLLFK